MATFAAVRGLLSGRRALDGIAAGVGNYGDTMQQARLAKQQEDLRGLQIQQHQTALAQQQREAQRQQQLRALAPQFARSPVQTALQAGGGPTNTAAAALPNAQPGFDFAGYSQALAGIDPMASLQMQAALKKEQPKLSKLEPMRGPDGQLVNVAVFEDGSSKILPYGVKPEMVFQDFGGKVAALDKNTVQNGALFSKSATPGELMSNSLGRDRLAFDRAQAGSAVTYHQDADGNFVALPTHAGGAVKAAPVLAPGAGLQPLQGKGAGLTEDQGKATGWLVQAENAFKNMKATGFDAGGNPKSAAYPGPLDAVGAVPGLSGIANSMRTKDRQAFMQASSSLSEALLRAATGAGVNKDEAAQKIREITPLFGEAEDVTRQKMASIPLYIESLKVRAGNGARKAAGIGGGAAAGDTSDPLGLRDLLGRGGGGASNPNDPLGLR